MTANHDSQKISKSEVNRLFKLCLDETPGLEANDTAHIGFIVGFRMYERMARELGKHITDRESRRFVPKPRPECGGTGGAE